LEWIIKASIDDIVSFQISRMQESENDDFQGKREIYSGVNKWFEQDRSKAEMALDNMELYKIHPTNKEFESKTASFGKTGFIKNECVNRYIGKAEKFY